MQNEYGNPEYARLIAGMKKQLRDVREQLDETDKNYPEVQKIIDAHWDD